MEPKDWIALAGFVLTLGTACAAWFRAAGAKIKAANADDRAEAAFDLANRLETRLITFMASKDARERAERDAGNILDRWQREILAHRQKRGEKLSLRLKVESLADEIALSRLREMKGELHLQAIDRPPGAAEASIVLGSVPVHRFDPRRP
jgi:sugar phosphate isomerase/epimerase